MTDLIMYKINETSKEKQVVNLCRKLGLKTRKLKDSDAKITVGTLTGNSKINASPDNQMLNTANQNVPMGYSLPELIVFSGLKDNKLDEFLAEYKKIGISPIGLKAVVTIHNVNWTMYELAEELVRERISIMCGKN
ncbi:DUF3783 domain-containing protein [Bovifimicola ammoniilytica]|uniref:DUF3783 domain-containing protein n=1 Tax=Bovifimicola ammoniilytica TaxID=2981720 RepID=UPI0008231A41|nr:DUF3783 domain-containing protein [Bovifimicola ammoniilytica]MCU6752781.1 DUF3783 domain-containing protein [Bovifimicola ammoniilytica]SCJ40935.1 Domain of uncharacterised function (DUF3783) [uncultured Eubacterium sp.]